MWDARDLRGGPEEGGALPGGGRAAPAGAVVLAHAGGLLQRGARALHEIRVRKVSPPGQHCGHLSEVSDHEGRSGK